jgi:3-phenylpropionate/cinnamic acid dioxygenase small subunit
LTALELQHEVEQFLFREARILDEGRYDDWLQLLTKDIHYWAPVRETSDSRENDIRGRDEMALFDDDLAFLKARVQRLHSGFAHAETPASRTRRMLSNIEIVRVDKTKATVFCNFIIYQTRLERMDAVYVGGREDILKRAGKSWRLEQRKILLDQTLLPRTVSILF